MQTNKRNKYLVLLILLSPFAALAQNNSSPYSVLGIGDIENSYFNRYTGMANTAVALSDLRYINNSNAASLGSLGSHVFVFELSSRFKEVLYNGADVTSSNNKTSDLSVRRANIAVKVSNRWGTSLGLQPFSTAAYYYTASKNIAGTNQSLAADYLGEGGVNQFYWANGYRVTKNTSLGVSSSFLFGSIKQTEDLLAADQSKTLTTVKNTYLRNFYFNFSLQTKQKINSRWMSAYGITYSPQTPLFAEYTVAVTGADGDTIKKKGTVNDYYKLPGSLTAGIALIRDGVSTFTVNMQQQNWSDLHYSGDGYKLVNSNKLSLGYQHVQKAKNTYNNDYEKSFFQFGLYGGKSYLEVYNQPITDVGASIGFGHNAKSSPMGYTLSMEVGRRGSSNKNLLSENYIKLNFTLSYLDIFFRPKKYN